MQKGVVVIIELFGKTICLATLASRILMIVSVIVIALNMVYTTFFHQSLMNWTMGMGVFLFIFSCVLRGEE